MFKIKNVGEYHDLCFPKDTLLWADVFEIFRNICLEMYEIDPAPFLTAPGLARQAALKEPKYKIISFNWYWYVINGKKKYQQRNMPSSLSICKR